MYLFHYLPTISYKDRCSLPHLFSVGRSKSQWCDPSNPAGLSVCVIQLWISTKHWCFLPAAILYYSLSTDSILGLLQFLLQCLFFPWTTVKYTTLTPLYVCMYTHRSYVILHCLEIAVKLSENWTLQCFCWKLLLFTLWLWNISYKYNISRSICCLYSMTQHYLSHFCISSTLWI